MKNNSMNNRGLSTFWRVGLLLSFLLFKYPLQAQVTFPVDSYVIDSQKKIIICNKYPENISLGTTNLVFDRNYTLPVAINKIRSGDKLKGAAGGNNYSIYFTDNPILKITVNEEIKKEVEISSSMVILDPNGETRDLTAAIKIRGASSSFLPKKSYRLTLKDDSYKNLDSALFNLRSDKRWLMLAMHNERLRLNNKISHDLWIDLHKLYYVDKEPDAVSSIRSLFTEVFINEKYNGVYLFAEDTDRKQLKLKKNSSSIIRGELYKGEDHGNTQFTSLPGKSPAGTEVWGGWEMKYPDYEDYNWDNLYDFTEFVRNSSSSVFKSQMDSKINMSSFIDYFLFINLLNANDNTGKNSFIARYKENEPYFMTVWDLDGTWGFNYVGFRTNSYHKILSNFLFDRLINLDVGQFKNKAAGRWFSLREDLLKLDSLYSRIDKQFNFLLNNKVYEREDIVWKSSYENPYTVTDELSYMKTWLNNRINFLDTYFNNWVTSCDAPQINLETTRFTNSETVELSASGCTGLVKWYDSPTSPSSLGLGKSFTAGPVYVEKYYYASCTIGSCISSSRSQILVKPNCSDKPLVFDNDPHQAAIYKTDKKITNSVKLNNGKTEYYSAKSVILLPGFDTKNAAGFSAMIKACD